MSGLAKSIDALYFDYRPVAGHLKGCRFHGTDMWEVTRHTWESFSGDIYEETIRLACHECGVVHFRGPTDGIGSFETTHADQVGYAGKPERVLGVWLHPGPGDLVRRRPRADGVLRHREQAATGRARGRARQGRLEPRPPPWPAVERRARLHRSRHRDPRRGADLAVPARGGRLGHRERRGCPVNRAYLVAAVAVALFLRWLAVGQVTVTADGIPVVLPALAVAAACLTAVAALLVVLVVYRARAERAMLADWQARRAAVRTAGGAR